MNAEPVALGQYIENNVKTVSFCGVESGANGNEFCGAFALGGGGID